MLLILSIAGSPKAIYLILPLLLVMILENRKELKLIHAIVFSGIHLFSTLGLMGFWLLVFLIKNVVGIVTGNYSGVGYNPFKTPCYLQGLKQVKKM